MVAPGMVFDPSDREIVSYYLPKLIAGEAMGEWQYLIRFFHVYSTKPSLLFDINSGKNLPFIKSNQRFFFSHRERISQKNENGKRPRRVVEGHQEWQSCQGDDENGSCGFWKSSTGEKPIYDECQDQESALGFVNVLNFFEFKNKNKSRKDATKTSWLMHEYRLRGEKFQEWVICKIKDTSCPGQDEYEHVWLDELFGTILLPQSNLDFYHMKQPEYQSQALALEEREETLVFFNETCLPSDLQMDINVDESSCLHEPRSGQIVCGLGQQKQQIMTNDDDGDDFKEVEQLLGIGNSFLNETCPPSDLLVDPSMGINVDGSSSLQEPVESGPTVCGLGQQEPIAISKDMEQKMTNNDDGDDPFKEAEQISNGFLNETCLPSDFQQVDSLVDINVDGSRAAESDQIVCGLEQQEPMAMTSHDMEQIVTNDDGGDALFKEMGQLMEITGGFLNEICLLSELQVDPLMDINADGSCFLQEPTELGQLVWGLGQREPSAMANNDVQQLKTNEDDEFFKGLEQLLAGINKSQDDDETCNLVELIPADVDVEELLEKLPPLEELSVL